MVCGYSGPSEYYLIKLAPSNLFKTRLLLSNITFHQTFQIALGIINCTIRKYDNRTGGQEFWDNSLADSYSNRRKCARIVLQLIYAAVNQHTAP